MTSNTKTVYYGEVETWGELDIIRQKIISALQTDGQRVIVKIDVYGDEDNEYADKELSTCRCGGKEKREEARE